MSNEIPTPSNVTVNGKSYRVMPITLSNQLEIAKYFRDQYMLDVNRQIVGLPKELASEVWKAEREKANAIEVGTQSYKDRLLKFEGLQYALFLGVRGNDAAFTLADAKNAFDSKSDEVIDSTLAALGYERKGPHEDSAAEKK